MPLEPLLTPKEVARYLQCSKGKVYAMARKNLLPVLRFGKNVRFRKEDLDAYLRAESAQARPRQNSDNWQR